MLLVNAALTEPKALLLKAGPWRWRGVMHVLAAAARLCFLQYDFSAADSQAISAC